MSRARELARLGNTNVITADSSQNVGLGTEVPTNPATSANTKIVSAGIVTAYQLYGDGSALTGVAATDNINTNNIAISGIATVGTSITMRDGAINVTGVITATSFAGDGSALTGVGDTANINTNNIEVSGLSTFSGDMSLEGSATGVSSVTWDASADSLIFKDDVWAKFGDGSDLNLYHDGTNSWIVNKTGYLGIYAKHGEYGAKIDPDAGVELYFDNAKKIETTNTGAIITGICTATSFENADGTDVGISAGKATALAAFLS